MPKLVYISNRYPPALSTLLPIPSFLLNSFLSRASIQVLNTTTMRSILTIIILSAFLTTTTAQQDSSASTTKKFKILVHITQGPENPTKAALGFLVARTALEEGHHVVLFLAGDAVKLLQDSVINSLTGTGTGRVREHYDAIVKGGGKFYLSGNSSKARGITDKDIQGKPAEFALPNVLVRLSVDSDRLFTY